MHPRVIPAHVQQHVDTAFFVHPSEGPHSLVVTPKFNGSSYFAWNRSMQRALGTKCKLGFINGEISTPDVDDLNRTGWERCNHLVQSWILNSLSESIAQTIVLCDFAYEVWQDLHERFRKTDKICIATLRSFINTLKQGTKLVLDYFTELKGLWEEFSSHRPIPNCVCVDPCRCEASRVAKQHRNEDQIMQFLTGLNDQFSVVKTQILLLGLLPFLNKVYSMVIQEESNTSTIPSVSVSDDSDIQLNASYAKKFQPRGKGSSYGNNAKPTRFCTFYKRTNHTVDFCYQKHGYPNFIKQQARTSANNISQVDSDASSSNASNLNVSVTSNTGLSQEQFTQLESLLQQSNLIASSSPSPSPSPSSNTITATPLVSSNISASETSPTGISFPSHLTHWLIDSGANEHICCDPHCFSSLYKIKPVQVSLPNGNLVLVSYAGSVSFIPQFHLTHVLYSPNFHLNLISVFKICETLSCSLNFTSDQCIIQDNLSLKTIGFAKQLNDLYKYLPPVASSSLVPSFSSNKSCNSITIQTICNSSNFIPSDALWHFRLGHLSHARLQNMISLYPSININKNAVCDLCHYAKHKHLPFSSSLSHASTNFELIHFDIWGPISTVSVHVHRYFLTILDDHNRFLWIILLKTKAKVSTHVKNLITLIQNQFHITPKTIRTDNGPEFMLTDFYALHCIVHHKSCVATHQQNGRVERKHQHILNVARALLFQSKLPPTFWSYSVIHVVFLINRVSTPLLHNQSFYLVLHNKLPSIDFFKVFGCLCYASTLQNHITKLHSRARKSIFLGYQSGYKGCVLFDLNSREIFISRHVSFHETILPYPKNSSSTTADWKYYTSSLSSHHIHSQNASPPIHIPVVIDDILPSTTVPPLSPPLPVSPRRSSRVRNAPPHLQDYVCNNSHSTTYPLSHYIHYNNISTNHACFISSLQTNPEPTTYAEASKYDCWN